MMSDTLQKLRALHPWPDIRGIRAWNYTLGGGGRQLVDDLILEVKPRVFLEIGCFLNASARRWLTLDPTLTVVGVDPWDDGLIDQCRRYVGRPALTRAYPDPAMQAQFAADIETQGPFKTAMANLSGHEDRFIPVRGLSPAVLPALKTAGLDPDIIYIDANKKADDLDVCHALWPDARMAGDDWHWARTKGYPMRTIVNTFAEKHGFTVTADHATWVLHPAK